MATVVTSQKPVRGAQVDFSHPLGRGLVGCFLLNEGTGLVANNLGSVRGVGTLTNGPTWGPNGLTFDGVNDSVACAAAMRPTGPYSVCAVCYPTAAGAGRIYDDGGMAFYTVTTQVALSNTATLTSDAASVPLNTWHHLAGVAYSATLANIYLNGASIKSGSTGAILAPTTAPYIGNRAAGDRAFKGQISAVWVYNYALTADQIRAHFLDPFAMIRR